MCNNFVTKMVNIIGQTRSNSTEFSLLKNADDFSFFGLLIQPVEAP